MPAPQSKRDSLPLWECVLTAIPKAAIRAIDTLLRKAIGVREFTDEEWCLIRIAVAQSKEDILLSDGTMVAKGEMIGELHLWNEHIPPMPRAGPDLAWGLRAYALLIRSFRALAHYLASDPELGRIRAWHGKSSFLPKGLDVPDALTKLGFDVVRHENPSNYLRRFIDFWDNFYWWMLAWTFNPASLKYKQLLKLERWQIWLSSAKLQQKYGDTRPRM